MRRSDALAAALAGAAILSMAGSAQAYCRTSSCPNVGTSQVCTPPQTGDCGVPLFWKNPCVGWSLQKNASVKTSFSTVEPLVAKAFNTWTTAACPGGGSPRMHVTEAAPADCAKHEYNQKAGNANIILFHDDAWPYEGTANTLALTTVTYNLDTGEIYDADMELNSADNNFTTGDASVDFDLLSILTHETGHFLGLAHSPDIHAVMFPDYMEHTTNLRDLTSDDINGICAIYPPGDIPSDCDPTPRHGFSTLCAADQPPGGTETGTGGCCTVTPGGATSQGGWTGVGTLLGVLVLAARRARDRAKKRG
jgi:hypothetical protein